MVLNRKNLRAQRARRTPAEVAESAPEEFVRGQMVLGLVVKDK
jgi:hypothetical protein